MNLPVVYHRASHGPDGPWPSLKTSEAEGSLLALADVNIAIFVAGKPDIDLLLLLLL